jgi:hypothetical protein
MVHVLFVDVYVHEQMSHSRTHAVEVRVYMVE